MARECFSSKPKRRLAVITCMDCRLVGLLEDILGIETGDAVIIKNAGNTLVPHVGWDVLRSLLVAVYKLDVTTIFVIGHDDCGMEGMKVAELLENMAQRGIPATEREYILQMTGNMGSYESAEENVHDVCNQLKNSNLFPDVEILGGIVKLATRELKVVSSVPNMVTQIPGLLERQISPIVASKTGAPE